MYTLICVVVLQYMIEGEKTWHFNKTHNHNKKCMVMYELRHVPQNRHRQILNGQNTFRLHPVKSHISKVQGVCSLLGLTLLIGRQLRGFVSFPVLISPLKPTVQSAQRYPEDHKYWTSALINVMVHSAKSP